MAGLPKELIQRAQVILKELEGQRLEIQDGSENIAQTMVKKDNGKHLSYKVQPMAESDQMVYLPLQQIQYSKNCATN